MDFLRGPGTAAEAVVNGGPGRLLYFGPADGNFVFAVRSLDPNLQMSVIRAGKLPRKLLEETSIETFCRRYGIDWVIFERPPTGQFWPKLHAGLQASRKPVKTVPLQSNRSRWQTGEVEVYRFADWRNHPQDVLPLPTLAPAGKLRF
jgi:hypothetical protein